MTIEQAVRLHEYAAGDCVKNAYTLDEQIEIWKEMEAVVAAKSERAAANIIRWYGCWDRNYTATAFVRLVRALWKEWENAVKEERTFCPDSITTGGIVRPTPKRQSKDSEHVDHENAGFSYSDAEGGL